MSNKLSRGVEKFADSQDLVVGNKNGTHQIFINAPRCLLKIGANIFSIISIHRAYSNISGSSDYSTNFIIGASVALITFMVTWLDIMKQAADVKDEVSDEYMRINNVPGEKLEYKNFQMLLSNVLIWTFVVLMGSLLIDLAYVDLVGVVAGRAIMLNALVLLTNIFYGIFSLFRLRPDVYRISTRNPKPFGHAS